MSKCIHRVARLLSWSVRAAVEPGQLPAAEICGEGGERRGHFLEVKTAAQHSHRESCRGGAADPNRSQRNPRNPRHPLLARRPSDGISRAGRCCGGPWWRCGGQLAGLPPLFEAASCRNVANSPHLPVCDFLLTCGWTRGRRAWARRCSPRGRDPPWAHDPPCPRRRPWAGGCDSAMGWLARC